MANTGQRQPDKKLEKKDMDQPDKAKRGTGGPGSDNAQADSARQGGHRKRKGGTPDR